MTDYEKFTVKKFERLSSKNKVCLQSPEMGRVVDTIEHYLDYLEDVTITKDIIDKARNVIVYERDNFTITEKWLKDQILDYAEDNYGMDGWEWDRPNIDDKALKSFCKKINKENTFYQSGEILGCIDISEYVKNYKATKDELCG